MGSVGGNGFKSGWEHDFSGWQAISEKIYEFQETTQLRIIVLGPGQGNQEGFKKRLQIRDHLNDLNAANEAIFLEDWVSSEGLDQEEILRTQAMFLLGAHIVFGLTTADSTATGILVELDHYRHVMPDFENITYLFVPTLGGKEQERSRAKSLIWEGVRNFPVDHILKYNYAEFEDCTKIRDFATAKVKIIRTLEAHRATIEKAVSRRAGSHWN